MKRLRLETKGFFALVDDEDYEYLSRFRWYAHEHRNTYYARRIVVRDGKSQNIVMHREILKFPTRIIDHKNRNGLDNQKHNLRLCTHGQNNANRVSSGKSKYLGVSFNRRIVKGIEYKYIRAAICVNRKQIRLGNFKTEELAAMAYNEAAKKYHGEFANLNII